MNIVKKRNAFVRIRTLIQVFELAKISIKRRVKTYVKKKKKKMTLQ